MEPTKIFQKTLILVFEEGQLRHAPQPLHQFLFFTISAQVQQQNFPSGQLLFSVGNDRAISPQKVQPDQRPKRAKQVQTDIIMEPVNGNESALRLSSSNKPIKHQSSSKFVEDIRMIICGASGSGVGSKTSSPLL